MNVVEVFCKGQRMVHLPGGKVAFFFRNACDGVELGAVIARADFKQRVVGAAIIETQVSIENRSPREILQEVDIHKSGTDEAITIADRLVFVDLSESVGITDLCALELRSRIPVTIDIPWSIHRSRPDRTIDRPALIGISVKAEQTQVRTHFQMVVYSILIT